MDATITGKPVGPVLRERIRAYEDTLDIVERPSVGTLVAPVEICDFITLALGHILRRLQWEREGARVTVRCTVDHTRMLVLEVADDSKDLSWFVRKLQLPLLGRRLAKLCSGSVEHGRLYRPRSEEMVRRLIIPLPRPARS